MSLFKRGNVWWFKFKFSGQTIRESTKSSNKNVATGAERARRRELEQGYNGISKAKRAQLFSVAAEVWVESREADMSPRSIAIEKLNLKHLKPVLGNYLLSDLA